MMDDHTRPRGPGAGRARIRREGTMVRVKGRSGAVASFVSVEDALAWCREQNMTWSRSEARAAWRGL